jgi:hypothetical protein
MPAARRHSAAGAPVGTEAASGLASGYWAGVTDSESDDLEMVPAGGPGRRSTATAAAATLLLQIGELELPAVHLK